MFIFVLMFASATVPLGFSHNLLDGMLESRFKVLPQGDPPQVVNWNCPETLYASCLLKPPFVTNSSERGEQIDGIFYEILDLALNKCCDGTFTNDETIVKTFINYTTKAAANRAVLHADILNDNADLILPVQSDAKTVYKGYLPYINIVDSPGVVLIKRTDSTQRWSSKNIVLWNAISSCWPIIVLTLLLSILAGMAVWSMERMKNAQEFGGHFCSGVFDGFWWAFVTMSTVGYGDKTPKSIIGRLFSVVWIIIGITICSILTATLSSALTSVPGEKYDVISGWKIGAARDSIALKKAINLGADAKAFKDLDEAYNAFNWLMNAFEDLDEVYNALVNEQSIDGMMEEMFIAMEYMKQKDNSLLSVVHLFKEKHGYGVAFQKIVKDSFGRKTWDCMSKVVTFAIEDDFFNVSNRHIKRFKKSSKAYAAKNAQLLQSYNAIDQKSPVFIGTVIGFGGFSITFFTFYLALTYYRGRRMLEHDVETRQVHDKISHNNWQMPKDGNRVEFMITELAQCPFK